MHLSSGDLATLLVELPGASLGGQAEGLLLRSLLDGLVGLRHDNLDVAGVGHVRVDLGSSLASGGRMLVVAGCAYATVSAVSATTLLRGLVDLNVRDDEAGGIETLKVGVGLGVLEETKDLLSGLDGPAGAGNTHSLACR